MAGSLRFDSFTYDAIPGRVVFGVGSRHAIGDEVRALGTRLALLGHKSLSVN